jgi:hypothetical protein
LATGPPDTGAVQVKVAASPTTLAMSPVGLPGGAGRAGTVIDTAFDSGLTPEALVATTLNVYAPLGAATPMDVTLPTGTDVTTGPPGAKRTTMV